MFLTRLALNPHNRDVQRAASDSHALHHFVLRMFGPADPALNAARSQFNVLHRLEVKDEGARIELFVQSRQAPSVTLLPSTFLADVEGALATSPLEPLFALLVPGARFRFRIRANPTRKIMTKSAPDGSKNNGKRVPLRGEEARITWLSERLIAHGMRIDSGGGAPWVFQMPEGLTQGRKRATGLITQEAHVFEGVLIVDDPQRAQLAVESGIGPAKAYGFGLLSLAPV